VQSHHEAVVLVGKNRTESAPPWAMDLYERPLIYYPVSFQLWGQNLLILGRMGAGCMFTHFLLYICLTTHETPLPPPSLLPKCEEQRVWMIYRELGFLAVAWSGSSPTPSPSYSVFLCLAGRAFWRGGRSRIIQQRESLVLFESSNILWWIYDLL
jgi:hypothetical protein